MAASTDTKVMVGTGAKVYRAPVGTALPTNETATPDAAFVTQGYIATDGFTRAINKAYATIRALGGDEIAKNRTELSVAANFILMQALDADVLKTAWGDDAVTVTAATVSTGEKIAVAYDGTELEESAWIVDFAFKGRKQRVVFARAQMVTESFEQSFTDEDVVRVPVELSIYKDGSGNYFYDYTDDGVFSA